jgi:ABC-type branched-subunit amino acid transport system ATPase component
MSFIDVRGLTAGYGKSVGPRGIDLSADEGESVAFVGKNRARKSTLLKFTLWRHNDTPFVCLAVSGRPETELATRQ